LFYIWIIESKSVKVLQKVVVKTIVVISFVFVESRQIFCTV